MSSDVALRADSHHAEGFACRKRGDYEAAIQAYTRAIELDPKHFKAYFNRGFAQDKLRNHGAAIGDYTRALELDPRNPYGYYNRCVVETGVCPCRASRWRRGRRIGVGVEWAGGDTRAWHDRRA